MKSCPAVLLVCSVLSLCPARGYCGDPPAENRPTFWVIPHTHWEGAVFKTREEYLEMGLPNILKAMRLLREQPRFHFTLDQVAYVRPFLERYPEFEPDFRRFIQEGRLQITGALDVMPDDNMPGGETFIRQMQYGKGYYREKLGIDVTSAWLIDSFGHHAQLPQLLAKAGFKSFWFVRGVPKQEHPAEFLWEGIDGTRIPSFYLPHSYALLYGAPRDQAAFRSWAIGRFKLLDPNARGADRVGLTGPDVSEPEEHLASRIEEFNRDPSAPFSMRMAVPADYEKAAGDPARWPVFKGELNPIFQGIYSSRIELKAWMRVMEQKLLAAETLGALGAWMGAPADLPGLWAAWEPTLFNQTHDLASGVMTDHVYDDTILSYRYSERRADAVADQAWERMASRIDTRGPGAAVLVFNPLSWPRFDVAEVTIGFAEKGVTGVRIQAQPATRQDQVPVQFLESTRYADGGLKTARIAFLANAPALGWSIYHVSPTHGEPPAPFVFPTLKVGDGSTELGAGHVRVRVDPSTGAITSLSGLHSQGELLAAAGNVVAREQDRGDLWELYKGLDGGSRVAMTTRQSAPARGKAAFSDEGQGKPGTLVTGPIFAELNVDRAFGSGRFATRVRVYLALKRIEITTRLVNQERYVRYQALFPTTIKGAKSTHAIPFGAIDRPEGIEFPAQNWVDLSDGARGLAILNIGLPGNVTTDGTMMLSLLRAHTLGRYGFGGGYEPGMSSESGFQLGQERTMRYALLPHAGDWRKGDLEREGLAFNRPLITRPVIQHKGVLPPHWSLLAIRSPNIVVSSIKPVQGGEAAIRLFETNGQPAQGVKLSFTPKVIEARAANLLEEPAEVLKVESNALSLDFSPFEIKTIRVRFEPLGAGSS